MNSMDILYMQITINEIIGVQQKKQKKIHRNTYDFRLSLSLIWICVTIIWLVIRLKAQNNRKEKKSTWTPCIIIEYFHFANFGLKAEKYITPAKERKNKTRVRVRVSEKDRKIEWECVCDREREIGTELANPWEWESETYEKHH